MNISFNKIKKVIIRNKIEILIITLIVVAGSILRFSFYDWDQGHYLHPDERLYVNSSNLSIPKSITEFLSKNSPLNPNMFYYGSFPLYIYKFFYDLFFKGENILYSSRLISAFFSVATIPFIHFLGKNLFSKKVGYISSLIFTFMPGVIQHAHFNTTESLLIFFVTVISFLSAKFSQRYSLLLIILLSICSAFSYATKIIGLLFLIIPSMAALPKVRILPVKKLLLSSLLFAFIFVPTAFFSAPYNLLDWEQFYKEQSYMQGVILGKDKPPFTIIYETTIPYISPLFQTAPFIFGFVTFPLSLIGIFLILKNFIKNPRKNYNYIFVLVFPIVYFLWAGGWYAKFARYYLLLSPFISIWASFFIARLPRRIIVLPILFIALNGALFFRIYLTPHTRIEASNWIYGNIPKGKVIATEHWDDSLPLPLVGKNYQDYRNMQLLVYDQDNNSKIELLATSLSASDYIVISSRRVYQSILNNKGLYRQTSNFYEKLFSEKLGFIELKKFTNYPFFISDDISDESFQSYDHPPVLIFENKKRLDKSELIKRINER